MKDLYKFGSSGSTLGSAGFVRRFRWLIILTWNIPPVFGLGFILLIDVLTPEQLLGIMTTPLEPAYIILWSIFAFWFFSRHVKPVVDWLDNKSSVTDEDVLRAVRWFPLWYWGLFLLYLVLAPVSVVIAADIYTDFVMTPLALFRIELVALIVSIIVGLPIFFLIMDLFGNVMGGVVTTRPIVTVKTKVFLIGALIPLLIDTMLVQYFWTRTGFFNMETFAVWLVLEMLAIGGSLIFVHSFGQSLSPLQSVLGSSGPLWAMSPAKLTPRSTDELGILSAEFRSLLQDLKVHNEILEINNKLLRGSARAFSLESLATTVIDLCHQAIPCDSAFIILYDENADELVGVAQTGTQYDAKGHYRIGLDKTSLAVTIFGQGQTIAIRDIREDKRVNPELKKRFGVKSALGTPLQIEGKTLGVLMAVTQDKTHRYTEHETRLFEALARETALALNAQILRQERRDQAEQVELLLNATEEGIYGVDLDGNCTFINEASVRLLGYEDKSELLGRPLHDLIHHTHPDGSPYPREQCRVHRAATAGRSTHNSSEVHWRKDGSSFPVEYWSHPISRDGEIVGTVVTFIDITERKRANQKLEETQRMLQLVLDTIPVRVFWKDLDSVYLGCNKRFAEDSGLREPGNLVGKTDFEMGWREQAELYRADDRKVMQSAKAKLEYVEPQTTPVGEEIWLETSKIPLTDKDDKVIGILGTYHDITARKQAEEELKNYREHLEELVKMRTAELEAVNKELEAFSYSVSHDLRAPLRSIDGFSQALLEDYHDKIDDTGRDYLHRVRSGAGRMAMLIDDLLQLSRVSRARVTKSRVDLGQMARAVIQRLREGDRERNVRVTIEEDLNADGDERLMEVVLENLLSNAWKYTGKVETAEIHFGKQIDDKGIVFYIRDNGTGFDMKYANKLFGAFQRLHSINEFEGTGIGLATVQRIIHLHGGRVWAEAEVDKGAVFYFSTT